MAKVRYIGISGCGYYTRRSYETEAEAVAAIIRKTKRLWAAMKVGGQLPTFRAVTTARFDEIVGKK